MADKRLNDDFAEEMFTRWPLDKAIDWISSNLDPEEVFSEKALTKWAVDCGFVKPEGGESDG